MTAINIVLGVISITGALVLIVALLAFVVARWINQPPISKQHFAQSSGEKTLASQVYPLSNGNSRAGKSPHSRTIAHHFIDHLFDQRR